MKAKVARVQVSPGGKHFLIFEPVEVPAGHGIVAGTILSVTAISATPPKGNPASEPPAASTPPTAQGSVPTQNTTTTQGSVPAKNNRQKTKWQRIRSAKDVDVLG